MRSGLVIAAVCTALLCVAPAADAFIYWSAYDSGKSRVGRAGLDASGVNQELVGGIYFGQGVATDGEYVYWGESGSNPKLAQIGRAKADGSEPNHAFQQGATYCGIFDLATTATEIFWLKSDCTGLEFGWDIDRTVKTGGQGGYTEVGAGNSTVCGFDVDAGHVYWSEGHYIARAPLPGPTLPERKWLDVGAAVAPCSVAVDAGHVYWTTVLGAPTFRGTDIGRASIDGNPASVQNAFVTGARFTRNNAVDVAGDFIYWTNGPAIGDVTGSIGRASLDGSGVAQFFVYPLFNPFSIDVDAAGPQPAPPGSQGTGAPFSTPPRMLVVGVSNGTFSPGSGSTAVRFRHAGAAASAKKTGVPHGTVFTFRIDQAATVTIQMQLVKGGRLAGGKCRKPTKALAKKKKCDLPVLAPLQGAAKVGPNTVPFTGRIKGKALAPGKYKAAFTASNAAGRSKALYAPFRVVRP